MSNPLYKELTGAAPNMGGFMQRLNQLKATFCGDPHKTIQEMLNSGKVTQDQYNRAYQQAQQIMKMMGKK